MTEAARRSTRPLGGLQSPGFLRLSVVAGPPPEGMTFVLAGAEHGIGRREGDVLLEEDETLDAKHAVVRRDGERFSVEAQAESVNGIWVRVRGEVPLAPGQFFRVGQQIFCAELLSGEAMPAADGTRYFASPSRKASFHVVQLLDGGVQGMASCSSSNRIGIGATNGTVVISGDPYLSAAHAEVSMGEEGLALRDLDTTNGTWLRVEGRHSLAHGELFYAGATLLRVEITPGS